MRRGLTLIEILLAVALLGAVAIVAATWLRMATTTVTDVAPAVRWHAAAERTIRLIEDALLLGDLDMPAEERVIADAQKLRVRTREHGRSVWHEFEFDRSDQMLERTTRPLRRGLSTRSTILDDVEEWTCELDEESSILSVTIQSGAGQILACRFEVGP